MATAAFNKFNNFTDELGNGEHDFGADTFKFALTSVLPTAAMASFSTGTSTAPSPANGYPSGGATGTVSYSETSGVGTLTLASDVVFTATAGGIGSFQYVILYNTSSTTPTNAVISWYDYGLAISLADTETLTISAGTILTIT